MPRKRSSKPRARPKPKPGNAAFNKYRRLHRFQVEFKVYSEHPELREDQRVREKQVEKPLGVNWEWGWGVKPMHMSIPPNEVSNLKLHRPVTV